MTNIVQEGWSSAGSSIPGLANREVGLDELSKYFHLPEKAVAKELGICLTSLKKLCRLMSMIILPNLIKSGVLSASEGP
jgi:hypothetical protein